MLREQGSQLNEGRWTAGIACLPQISLSHVIREAAHGESEFDASFGHFLNNISNRINCVCKDTTREEGYNDAIDFLNRRDWVDITIPNSDHCDNCPVNGSDILRDNTHVFHLEFHNPREGRRVNVDLQDMHVIVETPADMTNVEYRKDQLH